MSLTPEQLAYLRAELIEHGTIYAESDDRAQIAQYLDKQLSVRIIPAGHRAYRKGIRIDLVPPSTCENAPHDCESAYNCCDCGTGKCGCYYCWSCNACDTCKGEA